MCAKSSNSDGQFQSPDNVGARGEQVLAAVRALVESNRRAFERPMSAKEICALCAELGEPLAFSPKSLSELLGKAGVPRIRDSKKIWRYLLLERPGSQATYEPEMAEISLAGVPQGSRLCKPAPHMRAKGHASINSRGQEILDRLEEWIAENREELPQWITAREIKEMGFDCDMDASHFSELLQKGCFKATVLPGGGAKAYALLAPKVEPGKQVLRDQLRAARSAKAKGGQEKDVPCRQKDPAFHERRKLADFPEKKAARATGHDDIGPKGERDKRRIERFIERNRERLDHWHTARELQAMGLEVETDRSHLSELLSKLGYQSTLLYSYEPRRFNLLLPKSAQFSRDQLRHLRATRPELNPFALYKHKKGR